MIAAILHESRTLTQYVSQRCRNGAELRRGRESNEEPVPGGHELRTPLNAIGGYVQLLEMGLRGPVTDEQRADLERIKLNQKHLLSLINDVLSFTQLGAGHVKYRMSNVPVDVT